jgi:protein-S-isoprenylcysteine O-methyltransferase Ste14
MPKELSGLKMAAMAVFTFIFIAALLFVPAGTLYWAEGWTYIALFLAYFVLVGGWLTKSNPKLAKKRASMQGPKKGWDKIILGSIGIFMFAQIIIAGLDHRFRLSQVDPWAQGIGFLGIAFTLYMNFLVMKENNYLARIAVKQKGQKVVSTGPYAIVRHPMYAGFIPLMLGTGPALGSLYAAIPGIFSAIAMVARTALEDKMLQKELKGYKAYAKKVKYRLLPGIW